MRIALVHGAWADGSSWAAVIRRLQAAGHEVVAPQLPHTSLADNVAKFEARRHELEKAAGDELSKAQARAAKLAGFKLSLSAKAGGEGKLFGSVTTNDVAALKQRLGRRLPTGPLAVGGQR